MARSVAKGTIRVGFARFVDKGLALRAPHDEQRGYPEVLTFARSARRSLNHIVVFPEHTKAPSTTTDTQ